MSDAHTFDAVVLGDREWAVGEPATVVTPPTSPDPASEPGYGPPVVMQHDHAPSEASANGSGLEHPALPRLPLLYCPECSMPAWVEWRDGAGGAGAHVKIRCFARHWFLLPEDRLTTP